MEMNFILPLYNEEENIVRLISEIRSCFDSKIIIVDDGSTDSTFDRIPSDENIVKLKNNRNMGKGYAVKKALGYADGEYVCLIDGDVTGIMVEIHRILPILKEYDCVILTPPIKKGGFGVVRRISRYIVKVRTGFDVPWCISGMRVVRTEILKKISEYLDDRFGFEVSMTIELLSGNYNTNNINVDFKHRITTRNIKGFYHRGRQCLEILKYYVVSRK